ncbi:class I SAM-dependent methyltransferase [Luminiphilus sp.]|nr:class I SAM-dependent methyltransferase [Luminiphilus sp.]
MSRYLCNVCGTDLLRPVYKSQFVNSITSLCNVVKGTTAVYFCYDCTHLQTTEVDNIDNYYDKDYQLLVESEEEDQIYCIRDGEKVFRCDHQVVTLADLLNIPEGAKVLDYGCAKGTTLKKLVELRSDITPFLFDVSDMYLPFWDKFVDEQNWAIYSVDNRWTELMDVVTSFFSLEHVTSPKEMLDNIRTLLKDGGMLYCVVPDVMQNPADFVVLDHVNHFTRTSICRLLADSGFEVEDINTEDHASAMIVIARKAAENGSMDGVLVSDDQCLATSEKVSAIADYWVGLASRIQAFESTQPASAQISIYGAGFYGTYIASCLADQERIKFFLDRDPYRHGRKLFGKTIIDPALMPESIDTVFVGLNPAIARQNIEMITSWEGRKIEFFYL